MTRGVLVCDCPAFGYAQGTMVVKRLLMILLSVWNEAGGGLTGPADQTGHFDECCVGRADTWGGPSNTLSRSSEVSPTPVLARVVGAVLGLRGPVDHRQ
jgi:hypothetical protein